MGNLKNSRDRVYYEDSMNFINTKLKFDLEPARRYVSEYLQWANINLTNAKVVDFGCHIGYHTFGLMWSLNALECVGVDKDDLIINQAQSYFADLKSHISNCLELANYMQENDLKWWQNNVPKFLKELRFPTFIQTDITRNTGLEPGYDLVYCDRVLYHILAEEQPDLPIPNIRGLNNSVKEMIRVIKPDGWLLAVEPEIQDYEMLFIDAGLEQIAKTQDNSKTRYLYKKPR